MRRPTIEDVAQAAGVSKSTVSRVVNRSSDYIRPELRARVLEAIEQLGYRPSSVARSLVSKQTQTVGILVSDITNPYYPDVVRGIEDAALAYDYNVFLCNTNYDMERGFRLVRSLVDKNVDGVLIMSSAMSDDWLPEMTQKRIPVVVIDWEMREPQPGVSRLIIDFSRGIREAVDHLVGLGHTRLAHVSGPLYLQTGQRRRDVFMSALNEHGIYDVKVAEGNLRIDGGRRAFAELFAQPDPPTAIFAANDLTAIGCIAAARALGVRVPGDVSVCGMDNIWLASEVDPPLTTIELPRYHIGTLAMELLLHVFGATGNQTEVETVPTHLVIRELTAPATG